MRLSVRVSTHGSDRFCDRQRRGTRALGRDCRDRSRPLKHVQRARIVLHSADRLPVLEVAHRASVSRPAAWRWQWRYAEEGVEELLRDMTRPPGTAPVPMTTVAKVLALT